MSINCFEFRRRVSAEPQARDPALAEHRLACRACAAHLAELQALDARLGAVLTLPVPEGLAGRVRFAAARRRSRPRWLAAAAALLLAVGLASVFWWQRSGELPLDRALVAHVLHEPELLALPPETRVSPGQLVSVLDWSGARLAVDAGEVRHAGLCLFRGRLVAHLVVPGEDGPVTVILLPHVPVRGPVRFREQGFSGVLLPREGGSIAVLGRSAQSAAAVAERYAADLHWQG